LSHSRRSERSRISRLDPAESCQLFELRDALVSDTDARLRAAALLRLDHGAAARLLPYVRDACDDRSPLVREAAFAALSRARDRESLPQALNACQNDRSFRVRRMAVLYAVRGVGMDARPVVLTAARDPFWRVRAAAQRAAALIGIAVDDSQPELRVPVAALGELADADPAVVTLRLLGQRGRLAPTRLVGLLGSPHQALRRIAGQELVARADVAALREVLVWLEDERVPYGPAAAETVLAGSKHTEAVAQQVLAEVFEPAPAVLGWAIRHTPFALDWDRLQAWLGHPSSHVRRAAATRVVDSAPERQSLYAVMASLLRGTDPQCRLVAASWLARTQSREARQLLAQAAGVPTGLRILRVQALEELRDTAGLRSSATDSHAAVRARALHALSALGALTEAERVWSLADPDPWIREAALSPDNAMHALGDVSVSVRRRAVRLLADQNVLRSWAEQTALGAESDVALRRRAASTLTDAPESDATRGLLRLSRDTDLGVRSIAVAALSQRREAVQLLLSAGQLETSERIAAYTLLHLGQPNATHVETEPRVVAHVTLLRDVNAERAPDIALPAPSSRGSVVTHGRRLGKTGLVVHPFALSGAHGLSVDAFALARARGVNLFFWEPSHLELSRYLRAEQSRSALVAAGTYHADSAHIERDVTRALKALRRDALDVFLAFWTRSSARLDEVTDVLQRLARRGLVRAVGISTHDRALACDASLRGLDVVMVRHNAAHRGAEERVFPECHARGTGVLTFSNLCYGRMLQQTPAVLSGPVTAPDCYRYSLSQLGVHACIAAPRRHAELVENLAVTESPLISVERQVELRAHGDHIYARSKAWSARTWRADAPPVSQVGSQFAELPDAWAEEL